MRAGRFLRAVRALGADASGTALMEFAFTLPVLLGLYLGGYVMSDMLACNRKVTVATRALTDLATRCPALRSTGIATDPCDNSNIFSAVTAMMAPYSTASLNMRLTEVQVSSTTLTNPVQATVIWSKSPVAAYQRTVGSTVNLPTNMVSTNMLPNASATPPVVGAYLVIGELSETYKPAVSYGTMSSMQLAEITYMLPRINNDLPQQ